MRFINLLTVIFFLACSKDKDSINNTQEIKVIINSIHNSDNVKITIFEGWVNPSQTDILIETNKYYSKYRTTGNNAKVKLTKGSYTVGVYFQALDQHKFTKIEVSDQPLVISFDFNTKFEITPSISTLLASKINDSYLRFSLPNATVIGLEYNVYVNNSKLSHVGLIDGLYHFKYKGIKNGFNDLKFEYIYYDKSVDSKNYKHYTPENHSIDEIFSNIDEDYIKQDIFNTRTLVSLEKDTVINNNMILANKIIDGLYGEYKFEFKDKRLEYIEIIHGYPVRDPNYDFTQTKREIDNVFGKIGIKNNEEDYTYKINGYTLNLVTKSNKGVVVSTITKN